MRNLMFINRRMISRLMLKAAGLVMMGAVLGSVSVPTVSAQEDPAPGQDCKLGSKERYETCLDVPPKGFYTCRKKQDSNEGECVCRWGRFESGLAAFIDWPGEAEEATDVCELVEALGGTEEEGEGVKEVLMRLAQAVVSFVIAITVMAGLVILVASGYVYMTAGGDASRVQKAKAWMGAALAGIVLALLGYTILRMIAANLVTIG